MVVGVAVIGGRGRRLRPATDSVPKCMLPVGTKGLPMLYYAMKPWLEAGIKRFVFCVGYLGGKVKEYFGDGSKLGVEITYSWEDEPLGKGGAVKNALRSGKLRPDEDALMFWGDDIIRMDGRKLLREAGRREECTIVVSEGFRCPYGLVWTGKYGAVLGLEEKPLIRLPTLVGVAYLRPYALKLFLRYDYPFDPEDTVYQELIRDMKLRAHLISPDDWIAVNDWKSYEKAQKLDLEKWFKG